MKTQQELIDVLTEQAEQAEAKLEKAENYAKGLFVILEKAEVDNRTLLEQLQKAEAELVDIRDAHVKVMSEICPADEAHCTCVPILRRELAETCKEYHATRDEVDKWKRLFNKEYESRKIEKAALAELYRGDFEKTKDYLLGYAKGEKDGRRWERERACAIIMRQDSLLDLEKVELTESIWGE